MSPTGHVQSRSCRVGVAQGNNPDLFPKSLRLGQKDPVGLESTQEAARAPLGHDPDTVSLTLGRTF